MKWFKRLIISILTIILLFFVFYNPKRINLEGNWDTKELVLDGRKIYPDTLAKFILISPEIVINNWSKSISIPINRENIEVHLQYLESKKPYYKIKLSSSEKSLDGIFDVKIDTSDIEPKSYTVNVELKSHNTLICFQKHVIIRPWKPDRHRKGTPY
ncbi:MAG: hypothetical protein V4548_06650 [Bacteroidota bacterium]